MQNDATNAAMAELFASTLRKCGAREIAKRGWMPCTECPVRLHGFDINCATATAGEVVESVREWMKV